MYFSDIQDYIAQNKNNRVLNEVTVGLLWDVQSKRTNIVYQ